MTSTIAIVCFLVGALLGAGALLALLAWSLKTQPVRWLELFQKYLEERLEAKGLAWQEWQRLREFMRHRERFAGEQAPVQAATSGEDPLQRNPIKERFLGHDLGSGDDRTVRVELSKGVCLNCDRPIEIGGGRPGWVLCDECKDASADELAEIRESVASRYLGPDEEPLP